MSDDSSDESWNASQVPSDIAMTQKTISLESTPDQLVDKLFMPKHQTKQPLTTIFQSKQNPRSKQHKKPKKNNSVAAHMPLTFDRQQTSQHATIASSINNSAPSAQPENKNCTQAKPCVQTIGTLVFADCADMLDVLMHRKELFELCSRALSILVYPCNGFIEGMRFSHSMYHPTIAPSTLNAFLTNRPFQIGDDLRFVFVLVWDETLLNAPRIECVAKIYDSHPISVMDALHFSLCVSRRMIQ